MWMAWPWARMIASSSIWRISVLPLGSPTMVVPLPTTAMARWPARRRWTMAMIGTRLPAWRLMAVLSKPT